MATTTKVKFTEYWLGVLPNQPFQRTSLCGVTFSLFTEKVSHPKGALITKRSEKPGQFVKIDDELATEIKARLNRRVVRMLGPNRPEILDPESPHRNPLRTYKPREGDRSLGEFVYMVPTEKAVELLGASWQSQIPPSFAEMTKTSSKKSKTKED